MTTDQTIDDKLDAVLADYFQRLDAGEAVSPASLLASHPELENQLREFFDAASFVEGLAGPTQAEQTQMLSVHDTARNSLIGETIVGTNVVRSLRERKPGEAIASLRTTEEATPVANSSARGASGPQHFGRYEIQRLLGQGAMGSVYLAYDPSLQRQIALKIPKFSDEANPDMRDRFLREARSAATLRHANICPVYDVGRVDGVHYITMAYIEGRTLAEELRAGRTFQPREIATIVRKLALALGKAHAAGVIHRDLKPGNIMLDAEGEPVLMDFGLAYREQTDELRLTKSGMIVGSPAYMSPEQIEGDPAKIGSGSDIYSLGVVLYEMITGKLPFQGTMMSVIGQIATKEPTPISQYRPELANSPLERLCRKMLAKQIGDRPQTMQEVARALDYVLGGLAENGVASAHRGAAEGETARRRDVGNDAPNETPSVSPSLRHSVSPSPPHPLTPSPPLPVKYPEAVLAQERRERAKMFLATTLILVTLLGLFGAAAGIVYVATNQGTLQITSNSNDIQVEVASQDGSVKVIDLTSGTTVHRLPLGDYTVKVKGDRTDVFLDTNGFKMTRGGKVLVEAQLVSPRPGPVTSPPSATAVSPRPPAPQSEDGRKPIAQFTDHKGDVRGVAFSPDDRQFVSVGWDGMIHVYDTSSRQRLYSWKGHEAGIYRARYLPDGRLATCAYDGTVKLWDVATQDERAKLLGFTGPVTALTVSPDGKRVFASGSDKTIRLWNLDDAVSKEQKVEGEWIWDAAFAPDGQTVASVGFDGKVRLWKGQTAEPAGEFVAHQGAALSIGWVGNKQVLTGGRDGTICLWDVESQAKVAERSRLAGVWIESLSISKDGRHALAALANIDKAAQPVELAGKCAVLDIPSLQITHLLPSGAPYIYGTAISSDGRLALLATGVRDGRPHSPAQLWDISADLKRASDSAAPVAITEVLQIPGHAEHVTGLAVTREGKTIVSGSADGTVLARDIEPRLTRRAMSGHRRDRQVYVAVFRDGNVLISGDGDGKLRLNKSGAGGVHEIDAHEGGVMQVALSPDERQILTTGCDNKAKLWNPQTGELVRELAGHTGWVSDGAFVGDGSRIVTVSFDGHIKLWDAATAQVVKSLHVPETAHCIAASPDVPMIAAGMRDGTVRLYDARDLMETARLTGHTDRVRDVIFTPDSRHVISGSYDRSMRVWNVAKGKQVAMVEHDKHIFNALAVAPGGQFVFSAGGIWKPNEETNDWKPEQDYAIRMWQLPVSVWLPDAPPASGAVAPVKHVARIDGHDGPVFDVAIAADGLTALSTSDDYHTRIWDLATQKQVRAIKADGAMRCVAVTTDGSLAAWSGGQKSIVVWDLKQNRELKTLTGHASWVYSLQFTKDNRRLLSASRDKTIRLWDLDTGNPTQTLETINRQDVVARFSPDETKILANSDNDYTLTLWNVANGQPLARLHGHGVEGVFAAAFSPDGSQIATADGKGAIHLRDGASGEPRVTWLGHQGRVTALAFTPSGRHLVSGGFDGLLNVWDAQSGQLVARGTTGKPVTNHLAVLPSGKQVLSAGGWHMDLAREFQQPGDFAVHVWDLPAEIAVP
jgi:WD40 repeat protein/serine/threonine protein kinase